MFLQSGIQGAAPGGLQGVGRHAAEAMLAPDSGSEAALQRVDMVEPTCISVEYSILPPPDKAAELAPARMRHGDSPWGKPGDKRIERQARNEGAEEGLPIATNDVGMMKVHMIAADMHGDAPTARAPAPCRCFRAV